jgi:hypothetical protein
VRRTKGNRTEKNHSTQEQQTVSWQHLQGNNEKKNEVYVDALVAPDCLKLFKEKPLNTQKVTY